MSFDSVDIEQDDFEDMRIGAAGTELPAVSESFRDRFEEDICLMAKRQTLGGCLFVTVLALHKPNYSAVLFYEKCHFAKQTPLPKADVWPMYKTLWYE